MAFQLSDAVNKEKVYLIKWSNLEDRLDCEYYNPSHYRDLESLAASPFSTTKLKEVCSRIVDGPFGSAIKADDYVECGIPFIRVADVTHGEGTINNDGLIYISHEAHGEISRSKVVPGDVVIAKTGATMGAASVIPDYLPEANIRGDLAAISLLKECCTPDYAITYINTPIGQRLFWRLDSGGTRGRVVIGNLKKYPVVVPPAEIQNQIVSKMKTAHAAKKQKEVQAQKLLDSIDNFLLKELDIELPAEEENSISQRMFVRKFSEVSGGRFDAPGNWKRLPLTSTIFDNVAFASQVEINPQTDLSFADGTTEATFVPMEAVSDVYAEADLNQTRSLAESKGYTVFQEADLVWAKITPCMENGKSAVVQNLLNGVGFGSTEFHVFRSKGNVSINYIHAVLRLKCLRKNAANYFSGSAGHQRVDELFFRKMTIPIPPIEKQHEIAAHIQAIRDQVKQLLAEASAGLEQAKQEVEAMILGKDDCSITEGIA